MATICFGTKVFILYTFKTSIHICIKKLNNFIFKYFINLAKRFSKNQREIILKFKALHLNQQAEERKNLEQNKLKCKDLDSFGQPKLGMIFTGDTKKDFITCCIFLHSLIFLLPIDGMTVMTCQTPKFGKRRHSTAKSQIESRCIGVEVYCGPVQSVFLYFTDNMISGGSNIMIEVQRQALIDLAAELKKHSKNMTKEFIFQFDNCGENKVF